MGRGTREQAGAGAVALRGSAATGVVAQVIATPAAQPVISAADHSETLHAEILSHLGKPDYIEANNAWVDATNWRTPSYSEAALQSALSVRPGATRVTSKKTWEKMGRRLKPGAEPILMGAGKSSFEYVHPRTGQTTDNARVASALGYRKSTVTFDRTQEVYDIRDTEDVAPPVRTPQELEGAARLTAKLRKRAEELGFSVYLGGSPEPEETIDRFVNLQLLKLNESRGLQTKITFTDRSVFRFIATPGGLDPVEEAQIFAHELAHAELRHSEGGVQPTGNTRASHEIEAETYAYAVASAHGIGDLEHSSRYLAPYSRKLSELYPTGTKRALDKGSAAAQRILDME